MHPKLAALLTLTGLWTSTALALEPQVLDGKIVRVHDGDSVTLLDAENRQHKIRLDGIDAPELGQAFGKTSRRELQDISQGRIAQARCHKTDRYERKVCRVSIDGHDISLLQLSSGMAWMFRRYARELSPATRQSYDAAETEARQSKKGLWSDPNPQPPWDWRTEHASKPQARP